VLFPLSYVSGADTLRNGRDLNSAISEIRSRSLTLPFEPLEKLLCSTYFINSNFVPGRAQSRRGVPRARTPAQFFNTPCY
jgi:hypothetical protein